MRILQPNASTRLNSEQTCKSIQVDIGGSEFNFAWYSKGHIDDFQDSYLSLIEYGPIHKNLL